MWYCIMQHSEDDGRHMKKKSQNISPFEYLNAEPGLVENIEQLILILYSEKVNLVLKMRQGRNCFVIIEE